MLRLPVTDNEVKITIKKSLFISRVVPVQSADEAKSIIKKVREEHPRANHVVWASIIGDSSSQMCTMSDDGEPAGTAGRPVLAVLEKQQYTDILVTVTRYFGGIKLGTGGLVKAYTESVVQVLEDLPTRPKIKEVSLRITIDYTYYEQLKRLLSAYRGRVTEELFQESVTLVCVLAEAFGDAFQEQLIDLTKGTIRIG